MTYIELEKAVLNLHLKSILTYDEYRELSGKVRKHFSNSQPEEEARGVQHQKAEKKEFFCMMRLDNGIECAGQCDGCKG